MNKKDVHGRSSGAGGSVSGTSREHPHRGPRVRSTYRYGVWLALVLAIALLFSVKPLRAGDRKLVVENARIIVGDGTVLKKATVLVEGERIKTIHQQPITVEATRTINGAGKTLMPGIIDTHLHFFGVTATGEREFRDQIEHAAPEYLKQFHQHGVTTVRSMTDPLDLVLELRERVNRGQLQGPRIVAVGPSFTAPGGHPAVTLGKQDPYFRSTAAIEVTDPNKARQKVAELAARGVDAIKAVLDSGDKEPYVRLSSDVLRAVVDEAHTHGLKALVHTVTEADALDAADAGADGIEHGVVHELLETDHLADRLKAAGVVYTPTLWIMKQDWQSSSSFENAKRNLKRLSDSGVRIVFGTDTMAPLKAGTSEIQELEYMVEAGLSPGDAIRAATKDAAEHLGLLDTIGTIEAGKVADLILVDGDPLADIKAMSNIQLVLQTGEVVYDRDSEETASAAEESAAFNPVSWFLIPVLDMTRAIDFYEGILGVNLTRMALGPIEIARFPSFRGAPGVSGILMKSEYNKPMTEGGVSVYFSTPDIDAAIQRIKEKDCKIHSPKFTFDGKTYVCIVSDSEGNIIGLRTLE